MAPIEPSLYLLFLRLTGAAIPTICATGLFESDRLSIRYRLTCPPACLPAVTRYRCIPLSG